MIWEGVLYYCVHCLHRLSAGPQIGDDEGSNKVLLPSRIRSLVFGERGAKFGSRVKTYIGIQYVPIRIRFRVTVGDGLTRDQHSALYNRR
jgi:hypothetical protein